MRKKICTVMAIILCMISVCSVNIESTFAAEKLTNKQKYTYEKIVKKWVKDAKKNGGGSNTIAFSVGDINDDGIKELIVTDYTGAGSSSWFASIYDKNGECIKANTYKGSYALASKAFDHVYGLLSIEKYKNGIIMCSERYPIGSGGTYYKVQKNGTFKEIAHFDCFHLDQEGNQIEYYSIKGKKVNKSTYDEKVKSFGTGERLKGYEATQKNLNEMFGQTDTLKKQNNWKEAYRSFFNKKSITWADDWNVNLSELKFAFIDIDQNGIPELVLNYDNASSAYGFDQVYGYRDGKIVKMIDSSYASGVAYDKKRKMISSGGGNLDLFSFSYFIIKGDKAICVASKDIEYIYNYDKNCFDKKISYFNKPSWKKGAKRISKQQFEKNVKKDWGENHKKGFKLKTVTKKNLDKYLN